MPPMYTLPTFNLTVAIYSHGTLPPVPPRLTSLCNLALGRRMNNVATGGTSSAGVLVNVMWLLLPALTDIRGPVDPVGPDVVDCPAGSGRLYGVTFVDDSGKGFGNEHRVAILQQLSPWPSPVP